MTTIEIFDFILDSTFDTVLDWLDYFQDDYETSTLHYFIKTLSETEGSPIFYYLCHDKKKHEQTQNDRNHRYFTLLPDEKTIGTVTINKIAIGVRIFGNSEEELMDTDPWTKFDKKLKANYPGLTKYSESHIEESSDINDKIAGIDTHVIKPPEQGLAPKTTRTNSQKPARKNTPRQDVFNRVAVALYAFEKGDCITLTSAARKFHTHTETIKNYRDLFQVKKLIEEFRKDENLYGKIRQSVNESNRGKNLQ